MDIDVENVAVAKVSWVSILEMLLWLRFWGCQNRRKRSGITPVQRKRSRGVCKISTTSGAGAPERVGRGTVFQFLVYSIQLAVDRLTGDRWGQLTVVRRRHLHAVRPVASADLVFGYRLQAGV